MRSKQEIMKEVGDVSEHPTVASSNVNEYLFLEVLIDIRDQIAQYNKFAVESTNFAKETVAKYQKIIEEL